MRPVRRDSTANRSREYFVWIFRPLFAVITNSRIYQTQARHGLVAMLPLASLPVCRVQVRG
jgi:hypothetical protein